MKRVLSFILVLAMLCSLGTVFAQEEAPAEEAAGTAPAEEPAEEPAAEPAEEPEEKPAEEVPAEEPAAEATEEPAAEDPGEEPAADGEAASGTCGKNLTWHLDSDTSVLTISGTGAMTDYTYDDESPFCEYSNYIKVIEIESGVTSIGEYAFWDFEGVTAVTIADTVQSIGAYAFRCCEGLKSVTIPYGVVTIEEYTFADCTGLKAITLPGSVKTIGECAFSGCSSLAGLALPEGVSVLGEKAFSDCGSLVSVSIPKSLAEIRSECFMNSGVKNVYYPGTEAECAAGLKVADGNDVLKNAKWHYNRVTASGTCGDGVTWTLADTGVLTIGGRGDMADYTYDDEAPFYEYCDHIKTVRIENGVTSIGEFAFYGCGEMTAVSIADTVQSIGAYAFGYCSGLKSVTIPYGVRIIERNTFSDCSGLKEVNIPGSVRSIGAHAFLYCSSLADITLPEGVVVLNEAAFYNCSSLASVTIPKSLNSIMSDCFWDCEVENVFYAGSEADRASDLRIGGNNEGLTDAKWHYTCVITYDLNGAEGEIAAQTAEAGETVSLPDTVPGRDNYTFLGWAEDEDAVRPDYEPGAACTVGEHMMLYAVWAPVSGTCGDGVTWSMDMQKGTLSIRSSGKGTGEMDGYSAGETPWYGYSESIRNLSVGEGVKSIGKGVFYDCTGLASVTIPEGVKMIREGAFYDCTALESVTIPATAATIEAGAFMGCGSLKDVYYTGTETEKDAVTIGEAGNDTLVNAAWHYAYFTVSYDANGGTGEPAAQKKTAGEALTLSSDIPTRTDYAFLGWAESETADTADHQPGGSYEADASAVLYAVWKLDLPALTSGRSYTAKIENAGGSVRYEYTPAVGKNYVLYTTGNENVTIALYDSEGRTLATETNRLAYSMTADETYRYVIRYADDAAAGNIALKFGRVYTVKFNANGGTGAPAAQTKDYGTAVYLPETIPVREGFFFLGWAGSASAGNAAYEAGAEYTANGNTTLYAVWAGLLPLASGRSYTADIKAMSTGVYYSFTPANSNTYVLYANGGEDVTITLYDEAGNEIDSSSGEGASLAAKLTAGETCVYHVSLNDGSAGSVSLKFGRVYTIRYNANGGTGAPAAQTRNYGTKLTLTDETPVRDGYTFLGWSASSTAEKATYTAGGSYTANGNTTLYAVWQANA